MGTASSSAPSEPMSCRNCRNLVQSSLSAPNTFFHTSLEARGPTCPLCQLVENGLRLAEGEMRGEHFKWEVHVQNGLVLSAENNRGKVIVEFYRTSGKLVSICETVY